MVRWSHQADHKSGGWSSAREHCGWMIRLGWFLRFLLEDSSPTFCLRASNSGQVLIREPVAYSLRVVQIKSMAFNWRHQHSTLLSPEIGSCSGSPLIALAGRGGSTIFLCHLDLEIFAGVKHVTIWPIFWGGSIIPIKSTFSEQPDQNVPFKLSAMVRVIYIRLYGVPATN